jgi:Ca2+-binding RTX toxin-like protein
MSDTDQTHSFELTSGFFGAGSPTEWVYSFEDWNFGATGGADWDWSLGNEDDDWAAAKVWFKGSYDLLFGITGEAKVDLGKIETTIDVTSNATAVNGGVTTEGATVEVGTDIAAPNPEETYLKLDLVARALASAEGGGSVWGYGLGWYDFEGFSVRDAGFDFTGDDAIPLIDVSLADVLDSLDMRGMFSLELGEFAELSFGLPTLEYEDPEDVEDAAPGTKLIVGESESFINVEIDLDSFVGPFFGLDWDQNFADLAIVEVGIGSFDAKLNVGLKLEQEILVTPDVEMTLVTENGETLEGSLGDEFIFEEGKQEGEGSFEVTITYDPSIDINMVTSVAVDAGVDWKFFYANAEIKIDIPLVYSNLEEPWGFDFALAEGQLDLLELLGADLSMEISDTTYTLEGEGWTETVTVTYENDRTTKSGNSYSLTTNQIVGRGNSAANVIVGNAFANKLIGGQRIDELYGEGGNDRLYGGTGGDKLVGGGGRDTAVYNDSKEGLTLDLSDSSRNTGLAVGDTYESIENLHGSKFDDFLYGDDGNNLLVGGGGKDSLAGGKGDDTYVWVIETIDGNPSADTIVELENEGTDTIIFQSSYRGTINSNIENVRIGKGVHQSFVAQGNANDNKMWSNDVGQSLIGLEGNDHLTGADGGDRLNGGVGNDRLEGRGGDDSYVGGEGADELIAGKGRDDFEYASAGDSTAAAMDVIDNFSRDDGDRLILNFAEFTSFNADGAFTGTAGEVISVSDGDNAFVYGDLDGDKQADLVIMLTDSSRLGLNDLMFMNLTI